KAFELKLAQGAKTRGAHVEGQKVTEEIEEIRHVEPWKTINSPNRFQGLDDPYDLLEFLDQLRDIGQKPVGMKIVVGNEIEVEGLIKVMAETGIVTDFINVDGRNEGN